MLQDLAILNTSSGVRTPPSCSCSTNLNADASDTVTRVLCYSIADRKDTELGIGQPYSYNTWNLLPISFLSLTSLLFRPIQVPQLTWVGEHDYFGPGQVPQPTREMGKRTTLNPACLAKACLANFEPCFLVLQTLVLLARLANSRLANSHFSQLLRSSAFAICRPFYRLIFTWS